MLTPFELGYRYVVPAIKRLLVEMLSSEYSMTQREIAKALGMSQSAVSRYLSMERGGLIKISAFKDVDEMLHKLAQKIAKNSIDEYQLILELIKVTLYMFSKRYICRFHAYVDRDVDIRKCKICPMIFSQVIKLR